MSNTNVHTNEQMKLRTDQGKAFHQVFEILKVPFTEVDLHFTSKGLEIISQDESTIFFVHMTLYEEHLGFYELVDGKHFHFSVNVKNFLTQLKNVGDQILEFEIEEQREDLLVIRFYTSENKGRASQITTLPITLSDPNFVKQIMFPEDDFGWEMIMSRKLLHECIKNNEFGEQLRISFGLLESSNSGHHQTDNQPQDTTNETEDGTNTTANITNTTTQDYYFSVSTESPSGTTMVLREMTDLTHIDDGNETTHMAPIKILRKTDELFSGHFVKKFMESISKGQNLDENIRIEGGLSVDLYVQYE